MTVIVTNGTPPAIRGMLKRWFIEPKPNVFVGTVNRRSREKTIEYIRRNAPKIGLLVIASGSSSQGFEIVHYGETKRRPAQVCGHYLIAEKWEDLEKGVQEGGSFEIA